VLYLRHRLQKGFLARDQAPKEEEMANMNDYLKQLEDTKNLEAETIRKTKVHKVLKAIVKLESIPKEEEYNFKSRSQALLQQWSTALAAEDPAGEPSASVTIPATNGVKHDEKKDDAKPEEGAAASDNPKPTDADGDVSMTDAKAKDIAPAVKADANAGEDGAVAAAEVADPAAPAVTS
jgi:hypothetical protein